MITDAKLSHECITITSNVFFYFIVSAACDLVQTKCFLETS